MQYSRRYRLPGIQRRHDPFRHWVIWFISVRLDKGTEPRGSHTRTKFKGAYRLCESHGDRSWTVSYGATYIAEPGEIIATIPIGYADGYSRALSNRGFILHRGRRVPVAGRVTMDMIMVSLGENEGKQGEEVVIYGKQQGAEISVDEIAEMLGTISYEVLSVLSRRVPRFYFRDGKIIKISAPVLYV